MYPPCLRFEILVTSPCHVRLCCALTRPVMAAAEGAEAADEYGRGSDCFRDHRRGPFCFEFHTSHLHATVLKTAPDGFVEQAGLSACSIPWPTIHLDTSVDGQQEEVLEYRSRSPNLPSREVALLPQWTALKELLVPLDGLDLGSVPEMDIRESFRDICSRRYCHLADAWLPLSPVNVERDEGLVFPPKSCKLHLLLRRELELEVVTGSGEARDLEEAVVSRPSGDGVPHHYCSWLASCSRNYVEVITPPLSPISDRASPFIPEGEITVIDLTSEPTSPLASEAQQIQSNMRAACIDSDIVAPSSTATLSPTRFDGAAITRPSVSQDLRLDVPLVLTSSDAVREIDMFEDFDLLGCIHGVELTAPASADDEDKLATLLDDRQSFARNLAEGERFNPSESILRLPVPVLDFRVSQPGWMDQTWSAREHLTWLQACLSATFQIPLLPRDARLDSSLKWTPIPRGSGVFLLADQLELDTSSREYLTLEDASHSPRSARYIAVPQDLVILDLKEDEEFGEASLAPLTPSDNGPACSSVATVTERMSLWRGRPPPPSLNEDLQSICRSVRRKAVDDGSTLLPQSTDSSATSKLVSRFLELRAVKRPRTCSSKAHVPNKAAANPSKSSLPSVSNQLPLPLADALHGELTPALAPEVQLPEDMGPYIVSLAMDLSIIRKLERSWPAHLLIDRDYSQHATAARPPGTVVPGKLISPLAFEADISLAPGTGVVVTSLLKVKQKPLPGSNAQAPLYERVRKISRKYETLVVLVSESNSAGEYVGDLSSSDMAAYADFVRFTTTLDADVTSYLVHGAGQTLSKWILSLMCCYNTQALAIGRFVSSDETTWELFLRRAGLNVISAQVLSKTLLEEFGNAGLAQFLVMSTQEKMSRYGRLVGGQRVLLKCCEVLAGGWA